MTGKRALKASVAALLCAAAVLSAVVGRAGGAERETPAAARSGIVIAVVDMGGVLRGSRQWRDCVEERSRIVGRVNRTLTKLKNEVQLLRNDYDNLPPGTDERNRKGAELEAALRNLEQTSADSQLEVAQHQSDSVRRIFAALTDIVSQYAREKGIHLVLKKQDFDLAAPESLEQNLQIATADVLYADPSLDITPDVVERMNAAYLAPIEAQ